MWESIDGGWSVTSRRDVYGWIHVSPGLVYVSQLILLSFVFAYFLITCAVPPGFAS